MSEGALAQKIAGILYDKRLGILLLWKWGI